MQRVCVRARDGGGYSPRRPLCPVLRGGSGCYSRSMRSANRWLVRQRRDAHQLSLALNPKP